MQRTDVFISYSRADRKWLDALLVHLKYLEKEHEFSIWEDSRIQPGSDWKVEIAAAMESAQVAILLVSANFLASDFIREEELPRLLAAAKDEGALIYPIIISHCMFSEMPSLARFQALNSPALPLTTMSQGEIDSLFVRVTKDIRNALLTVDKNSRTKGNTIMISLARICVLAVLHEKADDKLGLQISDISKLSKLQSRKNIFITVEEFERAGIIKKTRVEKKTYWNLTEKGKDIFSVVKKSYLF